MLFDNKVWWMPACPNAAGKAIKTAVKVLGWVGIDNFKLAVDSFTEGSVG